MMHTISAIVRIIAVLGCVSSCAYYVFCLISARILVTSWSVAHEASSPELPPVSILKPLKGTDPAMDENFRTHCHQDYPQYEIIFGVSDPSDPAVASVNQLKREFPQRSIHLVVCPKILGPNVKVSSLEEMTHSANYEYLIVNDSDIRVEPDYLRRIVPLLADTKIGLVTCLYRGVAEATLGSRLESLGISTDFCAGVIAARLLEGGLSFGLGSTLAFRRRELNQIGGFKALVDFLADDYELGKKIAALGMRVELSQAVVETHLPAYDLRGFLSHQMRWARGVRDARLGGYIGLLSTFGLLWALVDLVAARAALWSWIVLGCVLLLRILVALRVGKSLLNDRLVLRRLWLLPLRDLIAFMVWVASFWGHTVVWRGERFELRKGRLIRTS